MGESLSDWIERLKVQSLPAMSPTVQLVAQMVDGRNTTNNDYQRILSRDPGCALAVFRCFADLHRLQSGDESYRPKE